MGSSLPHESGWDAAAAGNGQVAEGAPPCWATRWQRHAHGWPTLCRPPPNTPPPLLCTLADDVTVSVHTVARRVLTANVTATLGVDVPDGATGGRPRVAPHPHCACTRVAHG